MTPRVRICVLRRDESAADVIQLARAHRAPPVPGDRARRWTTSSASCTSSRRSACRGERRADVPVAALMADAAAGAGDRAARHAAASSCAQPACRWPWWSTSTAARPAWSPSRTWSRRSSARSPTSTTGAAPAACSGCGDGSWLVPGVLRPDEVLEAGPGSRIPDGPAVRDRGRVRHAVLGRMPDVGDGSRSTGRRAAGGADGRPPGRPAPARARSSRTTTSGRDEVTGTLLLSAAAAPAERVLRRRGVRRDLGPALADRAARRGGPARGPDRAVGDGARAADAGRLAARHHDLLARSWARRRAGHRTTCSRARSSGPGMPDGRAAPDGVRRGAGPGGLPARGDRRDGAEEPRVRRSGPRGAAARAAAGRRVPACSPC